MKAFILEKEYPFIAEGAKLQFFSPDPEPSLLIQLVPKARQQKSAVQYDFKNVVIKAVSAHGVRVSTRPVMEMQELKVKNASSASAKSTK